MLRVCILGLMTRIAWMPHIVSAFQERCEVRTAGPVAHDMLRDSWPGEWPPRGHIDCDLSQLSSLFDVLPDGWTPQLVVAVSGGGVPLLASTHDLPCPTVFYSVDTWQCYMDYREALHYDVVFAGQRAYVPLLRETGSRHVYWLPMACNPKVHRPVDAEKSHDIVFVGGTSEPVHWQRARLLETLQSRFDVLARERVYGEEMVTTFSTGRAAFNHSAVQDVNMRIFEALAMGCALLTNRDAERNGLSDLFTDGEHLLMYEEEADLIRKVSQLLGDEALRERLAANGRVNVLERHTYGHRVEAILRTVHELCRGFPFDREGPALRHDRLDEYIPYGARSVLDIGMGLRVTKYSVARRGIERLDGFSEDEAMRLRRAGSFDVVMGELNDSSRGVYDVAAIESDFAAEHFIRTAWTCLVPGGTLLLRCDPAVLTNGEPLDHWLVRRDFHLVQRIRTDDNLTIVAARKRTKRLHEIAREVCDRLRVPGVTAEAVTALLHPDW